MIRVNGQNVEIVHVRHDGRSYGVHAEDLGNFDGTQNEFLQLIEDHFDFTQGALSGYEIDITADTDNAVIRPQAKFGL